MHHNTKHKYIYLCREGIYNFRCKIKKKMFVSRNKLGYDEKHKK